MTTGVVFVSAHREAWPGEARPLIRRTNDGAARDHGETDEPHEPAGIHAKRAHAKRAPERTGPNNQPDDDLAPPQPPPTDAGRGFSARLVCDPRRAGGPPALGRVAPPPPIHSRGGGTRAWVYSFRPRVLLFRARPAPARGPAGPAGAAGARRAPIRFATSRNKTPIAAGSLRDSRRESCVARLFAANERTNERPHAAPHHNQAHCLPVAGLADRPGSSGLRGRCRTRFERESLAWQWRGDSRFAKP
ncbi:Hypothetical predicted protein [Olea europaea subsp. europaea]|uniref:Uncharacterized protein n=1 Tax=Olea europaea subsp. europaea TaxID=158383 RepID=A0A8S0RBC7_OLEEU|nr:Hypothetical predicted protein [Olea europaea subsp. europaea]